MLLVAAVVRSCFGFGDALIAMPLLMGLLGARTASPLVALVTSASTLLVLVGARREVQWREAGRLVLAALPGVVLGAWGLRHLPESWLARALGAAVLAYGLWGLRPRPAPPAPRGAGWAWPLGLAAGALAGAMNTSGPPLVIYATLRRWTPGATRGTLQVVFATASVLVLANHAAQGLWTPAVLKTAAACLPGMGLGVLLGGWLNRRIPAARFQRALFGLLVLLGGLLLL